MKSKNLIITGIIILIIILIIYSIINSPKIGPVGSAHEHADFMVFINGEEINFALPQYMVKVGEVHIEDMNGVTIHKHATGVTIGYFLNTLGFKFNDKCFITDKKEKFCNEEGKTLKFYVNGIENYEYGNYEIRNNDKYLISYGDELEEKIQKQLNILDKTEVKE